MSAVMVSMVVLILTFSCETLAKEEEQKPDT